MLLNHRSLFNCYTYSGYSLPSVDLILLIQFLVIDSKKLNFLCIKFQLGFMYFFQLTNDLRFWCIYYTLWPNVITGLCIRLIHDSSCHYQNKTCSYCCSFSSTSIVFYICWFTGNVNVFIATMAMVLATKKICHTATAFELKFICLLITWTHFL